jgi:hypothetical protein
MKMIEHVPALLQLHLNENAKKSFNYSKYVCDAA